MRSAFHSSRRPRRIRPATRHRRPGQGPERLEPRQLLTADAIALEPVEAQIFANEILGPPEAAMAVAVLDDDPVAGGSFLAVWQSDGEDGDGFGVFAQVFDREGTAIPGLDPVQVNQPLDLSPTVPAVGNQFAATVASDGDGRFVIAWQSEDQENGGYDIFVRTGSFDPIAGLVFTDQVRANSAVIAGDQTAPAVAMDDTGEYVVAWEGANPDPLLGTDIYFKPGTFAGGLSPGDEALANITTAGDQTAPALAVDRTTGDLLVAWRGPDPTAGPSEEEPAAAILMNLFRNTPDQLTTGELKVNASDYSDLANPAAAFSASGQLTVAWQTEGGMGTGSDIAARRFLLDRGPFTVAPIATDTAAADADLILNQTTAEPQRQPAIGSDASGNLFAVWQTQGQDGFSWAIFGRRLDAAAGPNGTLGAEFLVNTGIQFGPQIAPAISVSPAGRSVVGWIGPDVPVGAAQDSAITAAGRVGIRSTSQTAIDNIAAAAVSFAGARNVRLEGAWSRPYRFIRDDFDRPDNASLGADWTERYGGYTIATAAAVTPANKALATFVEAAPADVSVSGRLRLDGSVGTFAGFTARAASGIDSPRQDTMYWGGLRRKNGGYVALIRRSVDGIWETLSEEPLASGAGLVRFDVVGDSLKLFLDGGLVGFVRDRVLTTGGEAGFRSTAGTAVEDFAVAEVVLPTAAFPFRDNFPLADGSQLDRFWDARSGNFTVQEGRLVGANPVNTTTLRAALAADASIAMTVRVPTAGTHAGVLARGVPQRNTAYWGGLVNRSGSLAAEIWRIVDGRVTVLSASPLVAAADVDHELEFSLVGADLSLAVNGSPGVATIDSTLAAAGLFGMRATSGATIDAWAIETA